MPADAVTARTWWQRVATSGGDPAKLFLMLGAIFGVAYLVATPPFYVPDEVRHLRRVVQIASSWSGRGTLIPASIDELGSAAKRARAQRRKRDSAYSVATFAGLAAIALERERAVDFPGDRTRANSPLVYLPAVLATAAGMAVGAPPLALLYVSRLALLAGGLALLYAALRLAPHLAWPLCLVALLPMATFLRSGVSADTLTTGCAFLLFALLLRTRTATRPIATGDALPLTLAGAALTLCKSGYLPLVLAPLALPAERFASPRARVRMLALVIGIPVLVQLLWLAALGDSIAADNLPGASPGDQLRLVLASPGQFVAALHETWLAPDRVWRLAQGVVGRLLLLTVDPPATLVVLCMLVLPALVWRDDGVPTPRPAERLLLLAVAVACLLLMSVAAYLQWTPIGEDLVQGIQGRYLYPMLPVVLLALVPPPALRWGCTAQRAAAAVAAVAIVANLWGIVAVVAATWAAGF